MISETSQNNQASSLPLAESLAPGYPTVKITAPAQEAFVKGSVTVTAEASDNGSIYSVAFYLDQAFQSRDLAAPFEVSLTNLSEGPHTVFARTRDNSGLWSQSSEVSFTADLTAPVVAITSPTNCSSLSGTVIFQINATDAYGVRGVRFFIDNTLLAFDNQPPYEFSLETTALTNGPHALRIAAVDNAGNISRVNLSCNVFNNKPPTVIITSPMNGSEFSGPFQVTADAQDDQSVNGVDFYVDGVRQSRDLTAPYTATLNLPDGNHTLSARARDNTGLWGESPSVVVSVGSEDWKNFFVVRMISDLPRDHAKYAKQMGYSAIGISSAAISNYRNIPELAGLKFYLSTPTNYTPVTKGFSRIVDTKLNYSAAERNYLERNMVWKSHDPFPDNLAPSWWSSETKFQASFDFQQQRVIDELVEGIIAFARSLEDPAVGFEFAGYMLDTPKLSGDFNLYWPANLSLNKHAEISHWTGTDSGLLHVGITHEYPSYLEGLVAFRKKLDTRMKEEWPKAKRVYHPSVIYSEHENADEYLFGLKYRPDKLELIPDMLFQEQASTDFADDKRIYSAEFGLTPSRIGISQPNRREGFNEYENRLYASKAAIQGSWYNYFNRISGGSEFQKVTDIYPRNKLVRCVPNWDNLNHVPVTDRSWDGNVYRSPNSLVSSDIIYSRQPKTGKLFVVFLSKNGVIQLRANEVIGAISRTDGYFIEAGNAIDDFVITGTTLKLKSTVTIAVDSATGQIKGNGYIISIKN